MNIVSTLTQKGQVTIPASIRQMLGLKPFDKLIFTVKEEKIVAEPIKNSFLDLYGSVKYKGKKPLDFKKLRKQFMKAMAKRVIKEMKG